MSIKIYFWYYLNFLLDRLPFSCLNINIMVGRIHDTVNIFLDTRSNPCDNLYNAYIKKGYDILTQIIPRYKIRNRATAQPRNRATAQPRCVVYFKSSLHHFIVSQNRYAWSAFYTHAYFIFRADNQFENLA